MSSRHKDFVKFLKKNNTSSVDILITATAGYIRDALTELDEKDKQIAMLEDHIMTLKGIKNER